jgi:hypothetical protein
MCGYCACVWAVLFALANVYLQLGFPDPLQGGERHHFTGLIMALNLGVIPLKLVAAVVALALVRPWGERLPRGARAAVLGLGWSAFAILAGYPVMGFTMTALVETGILSSPPTGIQVGGGFGSSAMAYGAFFMIAGVMFGIASRDYGRRTRHRP